MSLPILTTAEDVKTMVQFLKNKPTGSTLAEAKPVVNKQVLDSRKINGYLFWDVILKDGDRFKLSPLSWEFVRKSKTEDQFFSSILGSIPAYRSTLEWAHHNRLDNLTNNDVASHWHEHHSDAIGTENESTIKDQAVCFFRLCEGAGLGSVTVGRRGQPTRITFERAKLESFVVSGPSAPPWVEPEMEDAVRSSESPKPAAPMLEHSNGNGSASAKPAAPMLEHSNGNGSAFRSDEMTVFISHGKNPELVEQVETVLGVAEIKSEIAVKEETSAIPVSDKVFSAMKKCQAAIIVVAVEEANKRHSGDYAINENVLIEIGAAFVLYDRRVVLLWDKRLPVPSNLQGLYRCEFEGQELNWTAGMKLMKAIKKFRTGSA